MTGGGRVVAAYPQRYEHATDGAHKGPLATPKAPKLVLSNLGKKNADIHRNLPAMDFTNCPV